MNFPMTYEGRKLLILLAIAKMPYIFKEFLGCSNLGSMFQVRKFSDTSSSPSGKESLLCSSLGLAMESSEA